MIIVEIPACIRNREIKDTQEDQVNHLSIENLLGGKETIGYSLNSEIDLYELSRAGLPKKSLMNLAGRVRLPISSISRLLLMEVFRIAKRKKAAMSTLVGQNPALALTRCRASTYSGFRLSCTVWK